MEGKVAALLCLAFLPLISSTGCPVGYDDISGKCYAYFGDIDPQNRDVADNLCVSANAHLWIIDDEAEFDMVTDFYQLRKDLKSGAKPRYWTDAYYFKGEKHIWASTGESVSFEPEQGTAHVCCSGQGCSGEVTGDCSAIGWVSFGAADSGNGFLGCDCHGIDVLLPGLCEVDPFKCPENGQFPAGKCGNHYWNCFDNVPTLNICGLELVFNSEKKYCDFPENVPGCA